MRRAFVMKLADGGDFSSIETPRGQDQLFGPASDSTAWRRVADLASHELSVARLDAARRRVRARVWAAGGALAAVTDPSSGMLCVDIDATLARATCHPPTSTSTRSACNSRWSPKTLLTFLAAWRRRVCPTPRWRVGSTWPRARCATISPRRSPSSALATAPRPPTGHTSAAGFRSRALGVTCAGVSVYAQQTVARPAGGPAAVDAYRARAAYSPRLANEKRGFAVADDVTVADSVEEFRDQWTTLLVR